ncbi:hypothetical protein DOT_1282 [Desulfosporosinus sp. OT]|nr:hypothetical protein DOT_1282 [Desulfosporosinus sp. OT]
MSWIPASIYELKRIFKRVFFLLGGANHGNRRISLFQNPWILRTSYWIRFCPMDM